MKFKIFFNEAKKQMDVSVLEDLNDEIILPKNTDQHLQYPVPRDLKIKAQNALVNEIPKNLSEEFIQILEDIKVLNKKRNDKMNEIRKNLNPKFLKRLEQFKLDYAEFFI